MAARSIARVACVLALLSVRWAPAWAHAFPEHCDPSPGTELTEPPALIGIRFDSDLEPAFSAVQLHDADGQRVDNNDGHVDPSDPQRLTLSLPTLRSGAYRVLWSVVARDGHRTEGDYTFTLR